MAKKKKARQKRIPGTYDEVPAEVETLVERYVDTLRERQALQEAENSLRVQLIEAFKEHKLTKVDIDGGEKVLLLVRDSSASLKIKAKKKAELAA